MELKTGYKQTEVGVIPSDWEVKDISAISRVVRGGSPRPAGSPKYFNGDFIPWLTVASLTNIPNSQVNVETTESFLTKEGSQYSRTLEKGTVIIANSGATLGIAKILNIQCCANDGIAALLEVDKNVDKTFVIYFINSLTKALRETVATGNGQPNLNTELIGNIAIPLPPTKAEQTAIATALSDTDQYITHLEKLIAKKRNIKQGAMQELLRPKEGWVVKKLGEIAEIYTGKRNNQDKVENGLYPFFVRSQTIESINTYSFDGEAILIPGEGNIGKIFHYIEGKFDFHQRVYKISNFADGCSGKYIYRYMAEYFGRHAMENSVKATVDSLRLPTFLVFEIPMPETMEEQNRIATILSDMDSEIAALEAKLSKAQSIKQGMMQQLLTGKIRLL